MKNIFLLSGLAITALASLLVGVVATTPADLWHWINIGSPDMQIIFADIRSPRIVLAALTGFVLGMAGAVVQGFLRNHLAEPSLLGASNSAALGAVIAIYFGFAGIQIEGQIAGQLIVPISAVAGALISVSLLFIFASGNRGGGKEGARSMRLILAGFAVSALAGAGVSLALNLSPNIFAALEIAFWLLGAVENRSWHHITLIAPFVLVGCVCLWRTRTALDALALGDDVAASLGVNMQRLSFLVVVGVALAVGAVVSVTGVIGFVGLIAPHLVRISYRNKGVARPATLVLSSGLAGAWLLVAADTLIRLIPTPTEMKLGVITAFLGVPVLLALLRARKSSLAISE
ncbi:MAG: iron ABC transporter permease [Alphaproteobacteria bacterium]|nr:iron ABC transporter permease [Alphaproteobacteria bacterium]MBE8220654.1 iron ABC transporter permease [Alphaproteobacteria bacterium]